MITEENYYVVVYASTAISEYLLFWKNTEPDVLTNFDKDLEIRFNFEKSAPQLYRQTANAFVFEKSAPLSESRKRSLALTVVLLALIYIGSTMVPNIWTTFKFTGTATAVSLGFLFPSLMALRLSRKGESLSVGEKLLSWTMLIMAGTVSIVGVVGNVYSLKGQSK